MSAPADEFESDDSDGGGRFERRLVGEADSEGEVYPAERVCRACNLRAEPVCPGCARCMARAGHLAGGTPACPGCGGCVDCRRRAERANKAAWRYYDPKTCRRCGRCHFCVARLAAEAGYKHLRPLPDEARTQGCGACEACAERQELLAPVSLQPPLWCDWADCRLCWLCAPGGLCATCGNCAECSPVCEGCGFCDACMDALYFRRPGCLVHDGFECKSSGRDCLCPPRASPGGGEAAAGAGAGAPAE
jgi:hypothetical protein